MNRNRVPVRRGLVIAMVAALPVSLTEATVATAAPAVRPGGPRVQHDRLVPGANVTAKTRSVPLTDPHARRGAVPVAWPAAGEANVAIPATAKARAGSLPVLVGRAHDAPEPTPPGSRPPATTPLSVGVRVLDAAATRRAGVTGLLIRVTSAQPGPVSISVDYSRFRHAFGGDWANRLGLYVISACAGCAPVPLRSANNTRTGQVTADVTASAAGTDVALAAAPAGSTGDYKATSLSPSASWQVSTQSGGFSWSYPLRLPPVPSGLAPTLSLAYDSGSVDGATASTNSQPSWIGQGWDLMPGFIERKYKSCVDDGHAGSGDLCWGGDNLTMSLNGRATTLVRDNTSGKWVPKDDDGSRIERIVPATPVNGAQSGEYWKVTTTDGTQYFFGLHLLPGAASTQGTFSTWLTPVYGDDSGEPCFNATFANASCMQAWRWNLDYVVDPKGNAAAYFYTQERNFYNQGGKAAGVLYESGGYVKSIQYGLRAGHIFDTTAPVVVTFGLEKRCTAADPSTCTLPTNVTTPSPALWPDVPTDLSCTSTTCTGKTSPTFWISKRLKTVTTQVWTGSAYKNVDSWTLNSSYTSLDNADPALWLDSIVHNGLATGANVVGGNTALPAIVFQAADLPNRVDGDEGRPPMAKRRIGVVNNESGGQLNIAYSGADCRFNAPPAPHGNTKRCFPVNWAPPGGPQVNDWFHKYVVTDVTERDDPGKGALETTHYDYLDGAAWHFPDTDEITPLAKRSWTEWRGYSHVKVTQGAGETGPASMREYRYYRGMDGDRSNTVTVNVVDSDGTLYADSPGLEGFELEQQTFNGTKEVSRQLTAPSRRATAAHTVADTSRVVNAFMVAVGTQTGRTTLAAGGFRTTKVIRTYDNFGNLTQVDDQGDLGDSGDDRCTRTAYVQNTAKNMLTYPYQVGVVGVACAATPVYPRDVVSFTRNYYDGQALNTLTGAGNITKTEVASAYTATGPSTFITTATTAYDSVGRITSVKDSLDRLTKSADTTTPATVATPAGVITQLGLTTTTTITNALNQNVTTTLEPSWGVPTLTVDVGGRRTEQTYDALGRVREVWLPGRNKPGGYRGNLQYAYTVRNDGNTSYVSTQRLNSLGLYTTGYELYDGFLRPRQTQDPATAPAAGRIVTDTMYDSQGRVWTTNKAYWNSDAPGGALLTVMSANVPSSMVTDFDGAGRPVLNTLWSMGGPRLATATTYGGDRVSVDPPEGGTATTTITDARGRATQLLQYHGDSPTGVADTTTYTYTSADQLATITDPAGNVWKYGYDLLGLKTSVDDPDNGHSSMTYDGAGQLATMTDARHRKLAYSYDDLGRKTGEFVDSLSGTKLAGWTYDTAPGGVGMLATSSRLVGGQAYTTTVGGYTAANDGTEPDGVPYQTTVTIPAREGNLAGSYDFFYGYDGNGTLSTMNVPAAGGLGQEFVVYDYDQLGNPVEMQGLGTEYVSSARYTERGVLSGYTLGTRAAAANLDWTHDEATDRLTRSTMVATGKPTVSDVHYTYDDEGNLLKAADTPQSGTADTQCFGYDYLRRLTNAWTPSSGDCAPAPTAAGLGGPAPYWHDYAYDLTGNRTTLTSHDPAGGANTVQTSTYPASGADVARPHAVTQVTTTGPAGTTTADYGYDAAGNLTTRPGPTGPQTITYDDEGLAASITAGSQQSTTVYDADGGRLVTHDSTGATLYLPGGMELHANPGGTPTATRYYSLNGVTVAMRTTAGVTWLGTDPHATATVSMTPSGVATIRRQDPFGNPRGPQSQWSNNRGFLGGVMDPSGLTHLGARDYDPTLGRFTTTDPVIDPTDPQQLNAYAYANNNPPTFTDPTGLLTCTKPDGYDCGKGGDYGQNGKVKKKSGDNSNSASSTVTQQGAQWTTDKDGTVHLKLPGKDDYSLPADKLPFDVKQAMLGLDKYLPYFYRSRDYDFYTVPQLLEALCEQVKGLCGDYKHYTLMFMHDDDEIRAGLPPTHFDGYMNPFEAAAGSGLALATAKYAGLAMPLGRGSTGRAIPANLKEQLALEQVMSSPRSGEVMANIALGDTRWPSDQGWVKMKQNVNGVEIHYVYNTRNGSVDDYKFK